MGKYFVWLSVLLMFAPQLRADVTLTNGTVANFEAALDDVLADGGGTITVTTPIVFGSDNDSSDGDYDGESVVVITGTATNSMFIIEDGSLALNGFTLQNGVSTNGGAIYVSADGDLTLTNCVFSNNVARGPDGFSTTTTSTNAVAFSNGVTAGWPAMGGAIFNLGSATVLNCQFLTNSAIGGSGGSAGTGGGNGGAGQDGASARGGGIYSEGTLTLVDTTFAANLALGGNGGTNTGVSSGSGGRGASAEGGGLFSSGADEAVTILNCTFAQNLALGGTSGSGGTYASGSGRAGRNGGNALGGGIDNLGLMVLTNCTFSANNAIGGTGGAGGDGGGRGGGGGIGGNAIGGGVYNTGTVSVVSCTFSKGGAVGGTNGLGGAGIVFGRDGKRGNSRGGNIANVAKKKFGSFHLMNTIIGFNVAGNGGYGPVIDDGFNISADKSIKLKKANNSFSKTNPLIGDLADNGGPTPTIALATNSPALDKIPSEDAPPTDQRGTDRPQNGLSDIGAYELDLNSAQIFGQPQSAVVTVGSNVTFSVTAIGAQPLTYQWIFTGVISNAVNGFTNSSLTLTNVQLTNAGSFQVIVSNSFNSVTSKVAILTVNAVSNFPPVITQQPVPQTVATNGTATFTVTATGTSPLFFQWFFVGATFIPNAITNATNTTLTITNVQATNQGLYFVNVTNNFGFTNSLSVTLLLSTNSSNTNVPPSPGAVQSSALTAPQETRLMPLTAAQSGGGPTVNFAFPSEADAAYIIEYKKSLVDPQWIPIATNTGTGDWMTNYMPTTDQPSGFYRVRSP